MMLTQSDQIRCDKIYNTVCHSVNTYLDTSLDTNERTICTSFISGGAIIRIIMADPGLNPLIWI